MLDFLKIVFLVVTAPLWVPFLKAMKRELLALFEEDGGLFGEDPGPLRRAEIRARRAQEPSVLVHEWLAHVRANAGRAGGDGRRAEQGQPTGQPMGPATRVEPAVRAGQRSGPRTGPPSPRSFR